MSAKCRTLEANILGRIEPRLERGASALGPERGLMDLIEEQLSRSKTIAVVGLSLNPDRPSHYVAKYLQEQGFRVIPVNPLIDEALGEKSYPDLKSIPEPIDMVDIFRRSELVGPVVDEAIEVGAKYIWMQDGVVDEAAAARARAAGIPVVMDN